MNTWVVANGDRTKFRSLEHGVPIWVDDVDKALQFSRRLDADKFSEEDEDAWAILMMEFNLIGLHIFNYRIQELLEANKSLPRAGALGRGGAQVDWRGYRLMASAVHFIKGAKLSIGDSAEETSNFSPIEDVVAGHMNDLHPFLSQVGVMIGGGELLPYQATILRTWIWQWEQERRQRQLIGAQFLGTTHWANKVTVHLAASLMTSTSVSVGLL